MLQNLLLTFVFLIIICLQGSYLSKDPVCGRPNGISPVGRIVGGYDVGYYKYPWYAAIISDNEISCGGTFIGSSKIITAAHCFKPYFKQLIEGEMKLENVYTVKLGIYNYCRNESSQKEYRSAKVDIHEKYFDETPFYDIAVITLDGDTEEYIPVCLPETITESNTRPKEGFAQGLGRLDHDNETTPCTLQEARLLMYPDQKCTEVLNSTEINGLTLTHAFCAGYLDGKIDTCLGDSGGPLLVMGKNGHYVLQGITSFGFGCAEKDVLGVYTDVSHFLNWIYAKSGIGNKTIANGAEISVGTSKPTTSNISKEISKPTSSSLLYLGKPPARRHRKRKRRKRPHRAYPLRNENIYNKFSSYSHKSKNNV